jgi:hypothetical protein
MTRGQIIALLALALFAIVNSILVYVMMQHRVDLRPGQSRSSGPSWSWQLNVLFHAEYDETGERLRRWVGITTALQIVAFLLLILLR